VRIFPDHVKKMCRDGDVEATKIGKTWILEKEQNPPKRKRISVDIVTDIGYSVIRRSDKALLKIRRNYR